MVSLNKLFSCTYHQISECWLVGLPIFRYLWTKKEGFAKDRVNTKKDVFKGKKTLSSNEKQNVFERIPYMRISQAMTNTTRNLRTDYGNVWSKAFLNKKGMSYLNCFLAEAHFLFNLFKCQLTLECNNLKTQSILYITYW